MPMQFPFHLAGCFCEPRTDHFHSGIDIKTNGTEGWPVFSIENGYISRIRVSSTGYGRALYITHPNGYTSVYAHLQRFSDSLETFARQEHYRRKSSELDITLPVGRFMVKKNDTIGLSGNSGSSGGPHLHFEIRDTKTEIALNPLDFYPAEAYEDDLRPDIAALKIYHWKDSYYDATTTSIPLHYNGRLLTTTEPVVISGPQTGFGIQGFDKQYNNENKNGLYTLQAMLDSVIIFSRIFDKVDFNQTRAVSACIDYQEQQVNGRDVYYCFQLPNNPVPAATTSLSNGILKDAKDSARLTITCTDFANNQTTVSVLLKSAAQNIPDTSKGIFFRYDQKQNFYRKGFGLTIPAHTFYDYVRLIYEQQPNQQAGIYSPVHRINGRLAVPLHKPVLVELHAPQIPARLLKKAYVVCRDIKGKESALITQHRKHWLTASSRQLGEFYAKVDTTAPSIHLPDYHEKQGCFVNNEIVAIIKDGQTGIASWNGYIDGQWVNFYYDAKNNRLRYAFDEYCPKGEHILKMIVKDKAGNTAVLQKAFIY